MSSPQTMMTVALAAFTCSAAACAHVQPGQSWPNLTPHLATGQPVAIIDAAGGETRGRLDAISVDSISLNVHGTVRQFESSDVRELTRNGDPLWNGLAIGAAIGAAAALVPDNPCNGTPPACHGPQIPQRVALFAITAALGVAADALHRDRSVLYRSPVQVTVHFVAASTVRRTGLEFTITWRPPGVR